MEKFLSIVYFYNDSLKQLLRELTLIIKLNRIICTYVNNLNFINQFHYLS